MSLRIRFKTWVIGACGVVLLKCLHCTLRWHNLDKLQDPFFWDSGSARLFAFWHGRQLMMPFAKIDFEKTIPLYVLISEHRDGRMIAEVVRRLGILSVAGSSSRNGGRAARELLECLTSGAHVALTPDGPKGPRCRSKPGVIYLASKAGKAIYPACYSAEKYWAFSSWDGMILPKPFSRAVRSIGEPIHVPPGITKEEASQFCQQLDDTLNGLMKELDSYEYS